MQIVFRHSFGLCFLCPHQQGVAPMNSFFLGLEAIKCTVEFVVFLLMFRLCVYFWHSTCCDFICVSTCLPSFIYVFLCLLLMEPRALWMLGVRQVLCFKIYLFHFPYLFIVYNACVCMCVFFCVLCMLRWRLGFDFESPTGIHLSVTFKLPLLVLPVCAIIPSFLCGCGIFRLRSSRWHSRRLTHWDVFSAPRLSFNSDFAISLPGDLAEVVYV